MNERTANQGRTMEDLAANHKMMGYRTMGHGIVGEARLGRLSIERECASPAVRDAAVEALRFVHPLWDEIAEVSLLNTGRVLKFFREMKVSETSLGPSSGYGYNDSGRETLDRLLAAVFGTESAVLRLQFVSGTHAISAALFGALRPGDELLSLTGRPYATLEETIRGGSGRGSLREYGITYREFDITSSESPWEEAPRLLRQRTRAVFIQKSRGYTERASLSSRTIGDIARAVRRAKGDCVSIVDNCYGEFVEDLEPSAAGADLVAGSLTKNPGGGIARTGGYIAGTRDLVSAAAARLLAPGIEYGMGATLGLNREFFQGLFMAPHVVGEALKGAVFFARLFENLGFETRPSAGEQRFDIVQSIRLGSPRRLSAFCRAIQAWSPVDSNCTPEPWRMPGYDHDVIMAAGTFSQGSSIELSADGPFQEPYWVYVQGGLSKDHALLAAVHAADAVAGAE